MLSKQKKLMYFVLSYIKWHINSFLILSPVDKPFFHSCYFSSYCSFSTMRYGHCSKLEKLNSKSKLQEVWASTCEVLIRRVSHPNIEPSVVCFIFLTVSWPEQRPSYLQVAFSLSWARFYCEKQNETGWGVLLHLGISRR